MIHGVAYKAKTLMIQNSTPSKTLAVLSYRQLLNQSYNVGTETTMIFMY